MWLPWTYGCLIISWQSGMILEGAVLVLAAAPCRMLDKCSKLALGAINIESCLNADTLQSMCFNLLF